MITTLNKFHVELEILYNIFKNFGKYPKYNFGIDFLKAYVTKDFYLWLLTQRN